MQMGNTGLLTGPSFLAPELTLQSDSQFKYDGSKIVGRYILRYGFDFNRIMFAGNVPINSQAPSLFTNIGASEESLHREARFPAVIPIR
jgi:hypothetical protein